MNFQYPFVFSYCPGAAKYQYVKECIWKAVILSFFESLFTSHEYHGALRRSACQDWLHWEQARAGVGISPILAICRVYCGGRRGRSLYSYSVVCII